MDTKYVYEFNEGDETMRELLGGKGANLAGMSKLGMPVPYGFTITTEACNQYYEDNETINDGIKAQIMEYLDLLEKKSGKKLGDEHKKERERLKGYIENNCELIVVITEDVSEPSPSHNW